MARRKGLTTYDLHRLDMAVLPLRRAFGGCTYLVGSVERLEENPRDVDVRTILRDEDFDAIFGGRPELWELVCLGMTAWLREQSSLPIDYQVQRLTQADEHEGPRNPLTGGARVFAGAGDATDFTHADVRSGRRAPEVGEADTPAPSTELRCHPSEHPNAVTCPHCGVRTYALICRNGETR